MLIGRSNTSKHTIGISSEVVSKKLTVWCSHTLDYSGVWHTFYKMQFKDIDFESAFTNLTEQEQYILTMRFGLNNTKQMSLYVIGEQLNLTRERIRQIEAKALRKLRRPDAIRTLLKMSDQEIEEGWSTKTPPPSNEQHMITIQPRLFGYVKNKTFTASYVNHREVDFGQIDH